MMKTPEISEVETVSETNVDELIVNTIQDLGLEGEVSFTSVKTGLKEYDPDVLLTPRDWLSAVRDCTVRLSMEN